MKKVALMVALMLAVAVEAQAYETDDFGFPVESYSNRRSNVSQRTYTSRGQFFRTYRTRSSQVARARYCPPAPVATTVAATTVAALQSTQQTVVAKPQATQAKVVRQTISKANAPVKATTVSTTQSSATR